MVTLTTIGFGDLVPGLNGGNNVGGQLMLTFTALYVMVGLAVLGMALSIIGESMSKVTHTHTHKPIDCSWMIIYTTTTIKRRRRKEN
jgi:hypothetical protein